MAAFINLANLSYVEALYRAYLVDPSSVSSEWRAYFAESAGQNTVAPTSSGAASLKPSEPKAAAAAKYPSPPLTSAAGLLQHQLNEMVRTYRACGHLKARIDPLEMGRPAPPDVSPEFFGFTAAHMDKLFACETMKLEAPLTLREIVERLERTYCGPVGVEFMHVNNRAARSWLQERMEATQNRAVLSGEDRSFILTRLIEAQSFEQFLRRKFLGAKSFSLEGAESLITLLDFAIEKAASQGLREIVLAMAHRGRLNVLANVLQKKPRDIFHEFIDPSVAHADGSGDVKYHLGYSGDYQTRAGATVHLSLCFNPSHLEFVNPVALGRIRAKQDRAGDSEGLTGMALLIHGDAAMAGEGVVQETLNLAGLEPYRVGGTVHIVLNNQIGFTTPPQSTRSSTYATDIAKMLQVPIFHVNGDDPEAVVHAVRLALEYRAEFGQDAVLDLYCYRRLGHNEGDEPSFTQPLLYRRIKKHKPVPELYLDRLVELHGFAREQAEKIQAERLSRLEEELAAARAQDQLPGPDTLQGIWSGYRGGLESVAEEVETAVAPERLAALLDRQIRLPNDFHPHPKIERAIEIRRKMAGGKQPLDWSAAESLALASLASEGVRVRLSGQDSERGTFSQRHAVLHDYEDGHEYVPLQHVAANQAPVEIYDSPLSEAGVLGFEYGYSLDCPEGLVLWEAQFGDFSNAAQVLIDQFITTAEEKWRRLSGIVLLLPHGFEGMGPEHSSARLERFLQLGARDNIQVVNATTPAQYFHCLRRQALRRWRKPLVMMTPKSLLRHPQAVSPLADFSRGRFQRVIGEAVEGRARAVERILLCSGKVYYDLLKRRLELGRADVPIVRLEQLYPFPEQALQSAVSAYSENAPIVWVQEEPENMGAWWFLHLQFETGLFQNRRVSALARPPSASPATGSATRHKEQQERLLSAAFQSGDLETNVRGVAYA